MLNPATLLRRTSSLAALGPEMHVNHQSMMEWAPADSNHAAILTMVGFMAFSGFLHDRPHSVSLLQLQLSSAIVARCCSLLSLVVVARCCLSFLCACVPPLSVGGLKSHLTCVAMASKFFTWTKGDRRNTTEGYRTGGLLPIVTDFSDPRNEVFLDGGAKVR